ncbi:MAG: LuxR C-terminal-related transcriptional regulator [Butyricimonas paravirosa]
MFTGYWIRPYNYCRNVPGDFVVEVTGLKNQEIADQLHISVNSVNTLKANAYKVLRDQLHDQYFLSLLFFLKKVCF